jgi:hypothetical protein
MQDLGLQSEGPNVVSHARPASTAIGLFDAADFDHARSQIPDLTAYCDYEDWRDAREGLRMGLAMAGVEAVLVSVRLDSFLRWRAFAGRPNDEAALDAFARLALTITGQQCRLFAVIEEADFLRHQSAARVAFGQVGYEHWRRHRSRVRANAFEAGLDVEDQPIRLGDYLEWSACIGQAASEPALDRYARLLAEHLLND